MTRRALVTGGSGYVGRHLVRHLLAAGWTVDAVLRQDSARALPADWDRRVTVHRHDGSTAAMTAILAAARPDTVFHLASLFIAEHKPAEVEPLIASNLLFGCELLEAMAQAGCAALVNTGTAWQHFGDAAYDPSCLYAATKQGFEALLRFYVEARGVRAVTLKLFDTYGPEDERPKLVPALLSAAREGRELQMTAGENRIDFVHIDDVARAFVLAAERLSQGLVAGAESYAVRSGRPVSVRELVALVEAAAGRPIAANWGQRPYRAREVMTPWTGGATLPGWAPRIRLEAGLRALAAG